MPDFNLKKEKGSFNELSFFYINKGYNFEFRKKRRIQWTVLVLFTRMEMKKNTKLQ